ncbi:type VI secretion system baseplate subunit TssF [Paraburkholderia sp. MPAMCS5]|uniref:type VI secretion system baseplate subunit TssF n=1 Tax=Paraburkholderia sp. MPAMCS5 TaxID=3112563 RepID=UPI002E17B758|nr:type VI secretion system baseplate subunit TssF [Paraburkholderia sp. MPAMCS5]
MDPAFPAYYQKELRYVTASFGEFAAGHPKIAARLGAKAGMAICPVCCRSTASPN